ncbi:hypothetical protein OSTOST_17965 [Ostertagia ostertagi]
MGSKIQVMRRNGTRRNGKRRKNLNVAKERLRMVATTRKGKKTNEEGNVMVEKARRDLLLQAQRCLALIRIQPPYRLRSTTPVVLLRPLLRFQEERLRHT